MIASSLAGRAAAQNACPAPLGRLIEVAPGVAVEVVEWSRHGEPLLFLSGLAKTAHAFDDFAPLLADRYRTVGITRRGWGRSSHGWRIGYDSPRLIADILAVMDSLALPAAHIVGWSYGGHEAVLLAAEHPGRVLSVILLDSYDNSPAAGTFAASDTLSGPDQPLPSPTSLREMIERQRALGFPDPISEVCATSRFSSDGRYIGPVSSDSIGVYTTFGATRLAYSAVTQPLLAIYGTNTRVEDLFPAFGAMDSAGRARAMLVTAAVERETGAARLRLRRALPAAHLVEIAGANHAIFRSHPDRVLAAMRAFLAGVGPGAEGRLTDPCQ
jgi:pimeloyl-ACP methyl ester carboxylesterase